MSFGMNGCELSIFYIFKNFRIWTAPDKFVPKFYHAVYQCSESSQFETVVPPKAVPPLQNVADFCSTVLWEMLLGFIFIGKETSIIQPLCIVNILEYHLNIRCRPYSDFQMRWLEVNDTNLPQVTLVAYLALLLE